MVLIKFSINISQYQILIITVIFLPPETKVFQKHFYKFYTKYVVKKKKKKRHEGNKSKKSLSKNYLPNIYIYIYIYDCICFICVKVLLVDEMVAGGSKYLTKSKI